MTRLIKIFNPFYVFKGKYVEIAIALFFLYSLTATANLRYRGGLAKGDNKLELSNWQTANISEELQ